MDSKTSDYQWFPPMLWASLTVQVVFTVLGAFWQGIFAVVIIFLLSSVTMFVQQHWSRLTILPTAETIDKSGDSTGGVADNWWQGISGVFIVLGIDLLGGLGIVFTVALNDSGDSWFGWLASWGGHPEAVITTNAIGIAVSIVGLIWSQISEPLPSAFTIDR